MAKSADVDIDMDEWEVLVPDDVAFHLFSDELRFDPGEVIRMDHFTCPPELDNKHHVLEKKKKKNSDEEEAAVLAEEAPPPPPPPHVVEEFKDTTNIPELSIPHPVILPKLMDMKIMESPKSLLKNNEEEKEEEEEEEEEEEGKKHKAAAAAAAACCDVNILGWRVSGGINALCSIGVAAATICMFILGGQQQRQQQQQQRHQNQRLQFQQHTDDKRMEQLMQQATRLNQALSVVRGVPMTRAHISFGGYYDGL